MSKRSQIAGANDIDEKQLRQMLDALPIPVAILHTDGTMLYRSASFETLFGYTPEDIRNLTDWWSLAYPDEDYRERAKHSWLAEIQRAIRENDEPRPEEWFVTCKDGSRKLIEFRTSAVAGKLLVMLNDITEKRDAQDALQDRTEELDRIFNLSLDLLSIADTDGRFRRVNPAWAETLGYSMQELEGRRFLDFVHPDDVESTLAAIADLSSGQDVIDFINRYRRIDGTYRWIEWRSKPYQDYLIVAASRDITQRITAEEALRDSEAMLAQSQRVARLGHYSLDIRSGNWISSVMLDELFGIDASYDKTVEGWGRILHPNDRAPMLAYLKEHVIDGREPFDRVYRIVRQNDGVILWVHGLGEIDLNASGEPVRMFGTIQDITERKQADDALKHSEALLNSIFEQSPTSTLITDAAGTATRRNQACDHLLHVTEDMIGRYNLLMDSVVEEQGLMPLIRRVFDKGERANFTIWYERSRLIGYPAEPLLLYLDVTTAPVLDPSGNVTNAIVQHTDLTGRKRTEENLALTNEELRVVNRLISETSRAADLHSILDMAVDEALRIVGLEGGTVCLLEQEELLELAAARATSDATIADLESGGVRVGDCLCGRCAQTGEPLILWTREEVMAFSTRESLRGETIKFHAAFPLMLESRCLGVLCVFTRTESKPTQRSLKLLEIATKQIAIAVERVTLFDEVKRNAEELERRVSERTAQLESANRELEAFSYSVSHDLRAPLRAIDGFSLALLEDCADGLDDTGRAYLARTRAASVRMGHLIDDILRLSRITRSEMVRRNIRLSDMVTSIAAELEESQPERRVDFVVQPDLVADADPDLMKIALENLVGNAWKFTSKREAARIEFGTTREKGKEVYYVRDNGAGFDQAYVEKLFGAFQRLHSESEFTGTGIGLATVKRVIHKHGGEVWAEGEVDKGAAFYFTLEGGTQHAANDHSAG